MKIHSLFCCFILFLVQMPAQEFGHIPRNIQKAIKSGTRTTTGSPGTSYWQNKSVYRLNADFNPVDGKLTGNGSITYYNNSPDTLKTIFIRLYQNMYKKGAARNIPISPEEITEGMTIDSLSVAGSGIDIANQRLVMVNGTNMTIRLQKDSYIAPNSQSEILINWNVTIPQAATIRFGKINPEAYFIALWYPQIAVYDDIDGWDRFIYNGEQEFYNNHNDFSVSITVPSNFGVWATGDLVNPENVLQDKFLSRYKKSLTSYEKIKIIAKEELKEGNIYKSAAEKNTWKFSAQQVPDFAFGTGSIFRWEAGLARQTENKPVFVNTVYREESDDYEPVWNLAVKSVEYFSSEFPGVLFPYNKVTVFNGRDDYGGGMEWPMIVNDPSYEGHMMTVWVTVHELAHMYMPFYLGTNERKYAWMDEGWAVMSSFDIQTRLDSTLNLRKRYRGTMNGFSGQEMDMPPMVPTMMLNGFTQQFSSYIRSAYFMDYLRESLSRENFNTILKNFINTWAHKHPTGYDFLNYFNSQSGGNLSWFIQPWMFENKYTDLTLSSVAMKNNRAEITVTNTGRLPIPVSLKLTSAEGEIFYEYRSPAVWKDNPEKCVIETAAMPRIIKAEISSETIPDTNPADNIYDIK